VFVPGNQSVRNVNTGDPDQVKDPGQHCYDQNSSVNDKAADHCHNSKFEDVIRTLADCVNVNRLPVPEPGIFTGDPLEYPSWRVSFKTLIESRNIPPEERVHYLKRFLGGAAQECVKSFLLMPTTDSYYEALNLIDHRFGDKFSVANAFKAKLEAWPKIANRDHAGLRKYSDFLRQCEVASRSNDSLNFLNEDSQNRNMCAKLPDWLVNRWARVVYRYKEFDGRFPPFFDFVSFLVKESDIVCDPVFMIKPQVSSEKSDKRTDNRASHHSAKTLNTVKSTDETLCLFCGKYNHKLERCRQFQIKTAEEKVAFVQKNSLCFGCLTAGHFSKTCRQRLKCETCSKRHPTSMHSPDAITNDSNKSASKGSKSHSVDSQKVKVEIPQNHVSHFVQDSASSKSTMIVPVYVSHVSDPSTEILVYALLDTQSDTCFVSDHTLSSLNVQGTDTTLCLSTMTAENVTLGSRRVTGLSIRGFQHEDSISLPPVYSRDAIPCLRDCIPTPEMTHSWPHLHSIANKLMPKTSCDVGLLIGYNCPQALMPREIIAPTNYGPFAQRTTLGWGIVGLVSGDAEDAYGQHICSSVTGSRIVLRTTAKEIVLSHEVPQVFGQDDKYLFGKCLSQEDIRFLEIMQQGVCKTEDGKYQMPLPFGDPNLKLPNNKEVKKSVCLSAVSKPLDCLSQLFPIHFRNWSHA
jgi:hypothetical protein